MVLDTYATPMASGVRSSATFAGPAQVLAYLARYTHRVAIGNGRFVRPRRHARQLPLEGLSGASPAEEQGHAAQRRRVHAPVLAARAARGLPSHAALWAVRQWSSGRKARPMSEVARRCSNLREHRRRPHQCGDVEAVKDPPACPCCGGRMTISRRSNAARFPGTRPSAQSGHKMPSRLHVRPEAPRSILPNPSWKRTSVAPDLTSAHNPHRLRARPAVPCNRVSTTPPQREVRGAMVW